MIGARAPANRTFGPALAATSFIAGAAALRVAVSGPRVAASLPGAVMFSAVLLAMAALARIVRPSFSAKSVGIGLIGAAVLVAMPLLHGGGPTRLAHPNAGLLTWSVVVTLVACSEELAFRGVLFNAVQTMWGAPSAVVTTSVAFALIHLPLYGWRALPLDLAVGIWLGVLRCYGGVAASATAHSVADLAAGWLL
jgi:membrane protease YdiL (CAAX protease family)